MYTVSLPPWKENLFFVSYFGFLKSTASRSEFRVARDFEKTGSRVGAFQERESIRFEIETMRSAVCLGLFFSFLSV